MKSVEKSVILTLLLLLLYSASTFSVEKYRIEDVRNVQLEDAEQYVTDPQRLVPDDDFFELNRQLQILRDSLGVETAVVVLPAIDDEEYATAKDFAFKLFNYRGLGNSEDDNGLLILLLTAEGGREIVFETGIGIESTLTDGMSKLVQTKKMIPYLKDGEYGKGLIVGVQEITKIFEGTSEFKESKGLKGNKKPLLIYLVVGFLALIGIDAGKKKKITDSDSPYRNAIDSGALKGAGCWAAVLFLPQFLIYMIIKSVMGRGKGAALDCEKCRAKSSVKLVDKPEIKQEAIPGQDGMKEYRFECSKCGFSHIELVPYKYVKPATKSSDSGERVINSTSRRGGSWGGGSSGGGGASTKF